MRRALPERPLIAATPRDFQPTAPPGRLRRAADLAPGPGVVAAALLIGAPAALLSFHVSAIFGLVLGAELLAAVLLGGLALLPRSGSARADQRALLVRTAVATATAAAALGLLLPLGLAAAFRRPDLTPPVLLGAALFGAIALLACAWLFDSPLLSLRAPAPDQLLPATTARPVVAGRIVGLLAGVGAGLWGSGLFTAPLLSAFGLALLGNTLGLSALAAGLIVRPALPYLLPPPLNTNTPELPHGLLLGAGLGSLAQAALAVLFRPPRPPEEHRPLTEAGLAPDPPTQPTAPPAGSGLVALVRGTYLRAFSRRLVFASGLYLLAGLATFGAASRGPLQLTIFEVLGLGLLAALVVSLVQLCAGAVALRTRGVPLLGTAVVLLLAGGRLGLDPIVLLLLISLALASLPLYAEFANQLRAGREIGQAGLRGQQIVAALLGLAVGLAVVGAAFGPYFEHGFIPPAAVALSTALDLLDRAGGLGPLTPWLLLGATLQALGGAHRQAGLLFATGLMIGFPDAGWALLAGLAVRLALGVALRGRAETPLAIIGLGCIGGEMARTGTGG